MVDGRELPPVDTGEQVVRPVMIDGLRGTVQPEPGVVLDHLPEQSPEIVVLTLQSANLAVTRGQGELELMEMVDARFDLADASINVVRRLAQTVPEAVPVKGQQGGSQRERGPVIHRQHSRLWKKHREQRTKTRACTLKRLRCAVENNRGAAVNSRIRKRSQQRVVITFSCSSSPMTIRA